MPPTPQQRRAADRRPEGADREGMIRIMFVAIMVAVVGGFGWWYWQHETGRGEVRDSTPAWSRDSQHVIYAAEVENQSELFVIDLNGRQPQRLTTTAANEGAPAYSPTGDIAFQTDQDGNFEIYRMRENGDAPQRLTNSPARDLSPGWSPDGRSIVFMSNRDNPEFDIYRMDADGKNVERLTNGGANGMPQYSPDGSQIAFQTGRDLYVLPLKGRVARRLTHEPLNGMYPTWSSDGSQIAFMSWRNGHTEIFTARSNGLDQQLLVSMPRGDAVEPRWSPDGTHIAFVHLPDGRGRDESQGGQSVVYIVDVGTKRLKRLSR